MRHQESRLINGQCYIRPQATLEESDGVFDRHNLHLGDHFRIADNLRVVSRKHLRSRRQLCPLLQRYTAIDLSF